MRTTSTCVDSGAVCVALTDCLSTVAVQALPSTATATMHTLRIGFLPRRPKHPSGGRRPRGTGRHLVPSVPEVKKKPRSRGVSVVDAARSLRTGVSHLHPHPPSLLLTVAGSIAPASVTTRDGRRKRVDDHAHGNVTGRQPARHRDTFTSGSALGDDDAGEPAETARGEERSVDDLR